MDCYIPTVRSFVRPSIHASVNPSVRSSIRLSVLPSVHPSIRTTLRSKIAIVSANSTVPMTLSHLPLTSPKWEGKEEEEEVVGGAFGRLGGREGWFGVVLGSVGT